MMYVFDGLIVLLFVLCVVLGYRRGFVRTVSGLLALMAALMVATLLSAPIAQWVYTRAVEPAVLDALEETITDGTLPAAERLDDALDQMPGYVTSLLEMNGIDSGEAILKRVEDLDVGETAVRAIATRVIAPVMLRLLELVCSLVLFLLTYVLARILLRALDTLTRLPLIRQMNRFLGLLAGALDGVLWAVVAAQTLYALASLAVAPWLTADMLDHTHLVAWLNGVF